MTSIKVTTLPLGLPLAIAWLWVAMERLGWLKTAKLALFSSIIMMPLSFAPIAVACPKYTGKWTGNPENKYKFEVTRPLAGVIGNGLYILVGAMQPPLVPNRETINRFLATIWERSGLLEFIKTGYPDYSVPSRLFST